MHKSQRFVHFYVELIAGFEPATSSLPKPCSKFARTCSPLYTDFTDANNRYILCIFWQKKYWLSTL